MPKVWQVYGLFSDGSKKLLDEFDTAAAAYQRMERCSFPTVLEKKGADDGQEV